jgi:carbon storage regulator
MLVLTRKANQSVIIGDDIEVIVLETKGDTAKIGIIAPKRVKVYRQEVYAAIKAENQRAAEMTAPETASTLLKKILRARGQDG